MVALFVHDNKFLVAPDGSVYSDGQFPYTVWQRYLKFFDRLIVAARAIPLSDDGRGARQSLNLSSGPNVTFFFLKNLAHPYLLVKFGPDVSRALRNLIQTVDAVIIRNSLLGRIAAPIAVQAGRPWALEVVGCAWDAYWNYGNLYGKLFAPLAFLGQKILARKAPFAIYVTQEFLQRRYPTRGKAAAVSDVAVQRSPDGVLERRLRRVREPASPFVLGLIGSLSSKYKGIQTAIAALRLAKESMPPFQLRILGGGDPTPWRRLAARYGMAQHIAFMGTLPAGELVLQWLDDVDVYLQPSFQEGLPRALVEAMSRGCPALGSTAGGIPELLPPEALHSPGDAENLTRLILTALDPNWRAQHAARNFQKARGYSKDVLDSRRDEFWREFSEYVRTRGRDRT